MKYRYAKYAGTCDCCSKPVARGSKILVISRGRIAHAACEHKLPRACAEDYPCSDMGYEDACAAACGPGL